MHNANEVLRVEGLDKRFGAIHVAQGISFSVGKDECLGILGPNGAGKTSLFNLMDGSIRPDAGKVLLEGVDISNLPAHKRAGAGISRAFQVPQPFADIPVFENVLVAARFGGGMHHREAAEYSCEVLEQTALYDKRHRNAGALTLLDRKRLELAKAIAIRPKVLLLDEIAGGLTELEGKELVSLLRSLKAGVAMIWIEHVAHALTAVADRLMVLHFGQKLLEGPVRETLDSAEVREIYLGIEVDAAH